MGAHIWWKHNATPVHMCRKPWFLLGIPTADFIRCSNYWRKWMGNGCSVMGPNPRIYSTHHLVTLGRLSCHWRVALVAMVTTSNSSNNFGWMFWSRSMWREVTSPWMQPCYFFLCMPLHAHSQLLTLDSGRYTFPSATRCWAQVRLDPSGTAHLEICRGWCR